MSTSVSRVSTRICHLWKPSPSFVVVLLITGTLGCGIVGCGGDDLETTSTAISVDDSNEPSEKTDSQEPSAPVVDKTPEDGGAMESNTQTVEKSASLPGADEGLQLPEIDVRNEEDDDTKESGPAKVGDGGIEMPNQDAPQQSTQSTVDGINLQYATWQEIESKAKASGKITVVDLWSTSCEPCVKEFPELVQLSQSMKGKIKCIGVSLDYDGRKNRPPQTYSEAVSGFLQYVGAEFDNYLCETPSDTVYSDVGAPSIPAVLIYDAKGNRVKQFVDAGETSGFSYEVDVIPFVEQLAG